MTGFIMKKLKNLIKEASIKGISSTINPDIIGKDYSFKPDKIINVFTEDDYNKIKELNNSAVAENIAKSARKKVEENLSTEIMAKTLANIFKKYESN